MRQDAFITELFDCHGKYVMWSSFQVSINTFPHGSYAIFAGGCLEN